MNKYGNQVLWMLISYQIDSYNHVVISVIVSASKFEKTPGDSLRCLGLCYFADMLTDKVD